MRKGNKGGLTQQGSVVMMGVGLFVVYCLVADEQISSMA